MRLYVLSSSVIGWKPPDKQANGGWTVKEGAAWLEPRSRWGPAGIGRSGGGLGVAAVWLAVSLPVAFLCGTILILLIVAVPFFPSCGYLCVREPGSSLFVLQNCSRTHAAALDGNTMSAGGRWSNGFAAEAKKKKNFRRTFPGPGFCRDCLERFFQNKWRDD